MKDQLVSPKEFEITSPSPSKTSFMDRFSHFMARTNTKYSSIENYLVDRNLENRLLDSLLQYLPDGAWIAGGFALALVEGRKDSKDIDIFCKDSRVFDEVVSLFKNPPKECGDGDGGWAYSGYTLAEGTPKVSEDTRFLLFTHPTRPSVQILRMAWYDSAEHVIDSFDLTVAQFAFDNKGTLYFNPVSFIDVANKRLVLHRMQFPVSTLRRIVKYSKKGFNACPGSLEKVVKEIQQFSGDVDVNQIISVD